MEAKNTSAAKKIEIEFLYLELDGCTRCRGTDANLETAIRAVQSVLEASRTIVNVRKALVDSEDMARRLNFVSSLTIRVNGRDIALELHATPLHRCSHMRTIDSRTPTLQGVRVILQPARSAASSGGKD